MNRRPPEDSAELSLTPCGPLDRGLARLGLVRGDSPRLALRALSFALAAWVPLLLLSLIFPASETTSFPFFRDLCVHVRLLLVVPTLILIERSIGHRTKLVAAGFLTSGLVSPEDEPRFRSAIRSAQGRLDSAVAEAILVVVSAVLLVLTVRTKLGDGVLSWYETMGPGGERLSAAGWWNGLASLIVLFLFLRWLWRYVVWCEFLRKISDLGLRVVGTHPDRTGGLGFVTLGHGSFAMLGFAASSVLAAGVANEILNHGARLVAFQGMLIGFVVLFLLVGLLPLLVFMKLLVREKRAGLLRYGDFALRYVQDFQRKWCERGSAPGEQALGSSDIQSLADLGGSFERLEAMRVVPIDTRLVGAFAFTTAGPMLPLLLTVMPLREIVQLLIKVVL